MWWKSLWGSSRKRLLASILSGLLYGLSQPGPNLWPLAWVCLIPLLYALEGRDSKERLLLGLASGCVAYLTCCYWIIVAVNKYGGISLVGSVAILLLLCLYLGSYWALFSALSFAFKEKGIQRVLFSSCLWTVLEYLRGHLLTGFPWALLAHSQWEFVPLLQVSEIIGAYGLSFVLAFVNLALYQCLKEPRQWAVPLTAFIVVIIVVLYGHLRLKTLSVCPELKVGIVQGNVEQGVKWEGEMKKKILELHRKLSLCLLPERPDLLIWPETAFPGYWPLDPLSSVPEEVAKETQNWLLFGALRQEGHRTFNSAFLLSPEGRLVGLYDKVHLVPFGEYLPLRATLERLFGQLREAVPGDISPGESIKVLPFPHGRFSVLICFEIIFPELAREAVRKGAEFLVTITNDAWFGRTSAPYQHLAQAVFRAVETRRWVLRAANTGISAVIDPLGRKRKETGLFQTEAFVSPFGLMKGVTPYVRFGDMLIWACTVFMALSTLQAIGLDRSSRS